MVNRKSDEISQKYFASKESAGYSGGMKGKISVRRLLIRWLESFDGRHMDTRPFLELSISFDSIRGDPQAVFNHLDKPIRGCVKSANITLLVGQPGHRKETYYLPAFTKGDQNEVHTHLEKLYNQSRITKSEWDKATDVIDNCVALLK